MRLILLERVERSSWLLDLLSASVFTLPPTRCRAGYDPELERREQISAENIPFIKIFHVTLKPEQQFDWSVEE